jgi:23S rRNA pseudouridine2605 synthase
LQHIFKVMKKYNDKKSENDREGGAPKKRAYGSKTSGFSANKKSFKKDDSSSDKPRRSYTKSDGDKPSTRGSIRKPASYDSKSEGSSRSTRSYDDKKPYSKDSSDKPRRSYSKPDGDKTSTRSSGRKPTSYDSKSEGSSRSYDDKKPYTKDSSDKPRRSYSKSDGDKPITRSSGRKPTSYDSKSEGNSRSSRSYDDKKPYTKDSSDKPRRSYSKSDGDKPSSRSSGRKPTSYDSKSEGSDRRSTRNNEDKRKNTRFSDDKKPFKRGDSSERFPKTERGNRRDKSNDNDSREEKTYGGRHKPVYESPSRKSVDKKRPFEKFRGEEKPKRYSKKAEGNYEKKSIRFADSKYEPKAEPKTKNPPDGTRLNKYVANAGICSRREADTLITQGLISVNNETITELGYKVKYKDVVRYAGELVRSEKKVYVLLNKPKGYISTVDDPRKRKTVLDLVGGMQERLYPVGRLDRETTGLIMLTNDGELTKKLTHPKHGVKKIYKVTVQNNVTKKDLDSLLSGVKIEDYIATADAVSYAGESKKEIGIELHSGKNRIVRKMMEALGYQVVKLDRVSFAGLTKKGIERGKWRFLTEKEVNYLRML